MDLQIYIYTLLVNKLCVLSTNSKSLHVSYTIFNTIFVSGYWNNFKKYSVSQINGLGLPYDYDSIMHYPNNAFVKSWKLLWSKTLIPKKTNVKIGQRDGLSRIDVKKMKKYYGCYD